MRNVAFTLNGFAGGEPLPDYTYYTGQHGPKGSLEKGWSRWVMGWEARSFSWRLPYAVLSWMSKSCLGSASGA